MKQLKLFHKRVLTTRSNRFEDFKQLFDCLGVDLIPIRTLDQARKAKGDFVLLTGGPDINPFFYGETNTDARFVDKNRDILDWTLCRRALSEKLPLLGICRGMQMINIACGGSLHQDIYRAKVTKKHPSYHKIHSCYPLCDHIPTGKVNSRHHQAVKAVAPGLDVIATSTKDNIIEAIYAPGILGVQWHPEDLWASDYKWQSLFDWFLKGLEC